MVLDVPSRNPVVLDAAAAVPLFCTVKVTVTVPPGFTEVVLRLTPCGTRSGVAAVLAFT